MTQHEMIELAKQAGFFVKDSEAYSPSVQEDHELTPYLETFAKLVAEKAVDLAIALEREACASMSDWILKEGGGTWGDAIRARGQA